MSLLTCNTPFKKRPQVYFFVSFEAGQTWPLWPIFLWKNNAQKSFNH